MKIKQMTGSQIYTGPFKTLVTDFEADLNSYLHHSTGKPGKSNEEDDNKVDCPNCKLEFFYFFDPIYKAWMGFRNAVWIKVHHTKGYNLWLRVQLNANGNKKVAIFCDRQLSSFPLVPSTFFMPVKFTRASSPVMIEKKRVKNVPNLSIIKEICEYYVHLKDICNAV